MKKYEMNGLMTYAHYFYFEVEAPNKKEALRIAKEEVGNFKDPAMAEFQDYVMDSPIEIKESAP